MKEECKFKVGDKVIRTAPSVDDYIYGGLFTISTCCDREEYQILQLLESPKGVPSSSKGWRKATPLDELL